MNTIIKYLLLPFTFSPEKLQAEMNRLNVQWIMHFNKAHYDGEWSALPLRSQNGSLTNVIPGNDRNEEFRDTELMEQCPYIRSIIDHFPCELQAARLLKLKPGAIIREHNDLELSYEYGAARIHVPVLTNPQVEFYIENERVEMVAGSCWYMNFNLPHRINNFGETDRIHLVIDIVVNDKIRELFENVAPERKKIIPEKEKYSADQKLQIIRQLKEMNTPTAIELALKMEEEMET